MPSGASALHGELFDAVTACAAALRQSRPDTVRHALLEAALGQLCDADDRICDGDLASSAGLLQRGLALLTDAVFAGEPGPDHAAVAIGLASRVSDGVRRLQG